MIFKTEIDDFKCWIEREHGKHGEKALNRLRMFYNRDELTTISKSYECNASKVCLQMPFCECVCVFFNFLCSNFACVY